MDKELNLGEIANEVKENINNESKTQISNDSIIEETNSNINTTVKVDEPVIYIGESTLATEDNIRYVCENSDVFLGEKDLNAIDTSFEIRDDELKGVMPDLDELSYKKSSEFLKTSLGKYRRNLIINAGLTIEEADTAVNNRLKNEGKKINDGYLKENPKVAVVEIDKKNSDKIEFTPEEKEKIVRAKAIKLIEVEDCELKTLNIEKVEKSVKVNYLRSIEGNLSKYAVPLPVSGDYMEFKGAQIIQLVSTVSYEDESLDETIQKKASLVYDRMYHGTLTTKYNEDNKIVLSYSDFINSFKFHDLDMALYGILVASSTEETEAPITCGLCENSFQWKYNLKSLLKLENISDKFKANIDTILGNKYDNKILGELNTAANKVKRFKSPFTNNIYDIAYPSIARAIRIFQTIDQKDATLVYHSAIGLFLHNLLKYNKSKDSYVKIEEDEIKLLMEELQLLPQQDLDMLSLQIQSMQFVPEFILTSQCPACGNKMTNDMPIDHLIFLRAQDTPTEIR